MRILVPNDNQTTSQYMLRMSNLFVWNFFYYSFHFVSFCFVLFLFIYEIMLLMLLNLIVSCSILTLLPCIQNELDISSFEMKPISNLILERVFKTELFRA
jgi:hypothetical protein